jgi:hypothetical protein
MLQTVGRGGAWRETSGSGVGEYLRNASDQFFIEYQIVGLHSTESATDMNSADVNRGLGRS